MTSSEHRHAACCELVHEAASRAGRTRIRACGASMIPAVWPGNLLAIENCKPSSLQRGDIVLIRREGRLFAHRVQRIEDGCIFTRGDAVSTIDPPASADHLVGRVVAIDRGGRTLSPGLTLLQRFSSVLLRRSTLLLRVTLFLARRLRATWDLQPSFRESWSDTSK